MSNHDLAILKRQSPALFKAVINEIDRACGLTPLMLAVKSDTAEVTQWLISQDTGLDLFAPAERAL